jgi:hypothetical protein
MVVGMKFWPGVATTLLAYDPQASTTAITPHVNCCFIFSSFAATFPRSRRSLWD